MAPSCPPGEAAAAAGWRRDVAILAVAVFLTMVSFSMVLPFLPLYLKEMGVSAGIEAWSGLIYGASFLSGGLMAPVWGTLGDRFGQKAMVLRSGVAIAAVNVLMSWAGSPRELLLLRVVNGLLGGFLPATNALVAVRVPAADLGTALSYIQVATAAGGIAGPLFGGALADGVGMRETFLVAAAVMAASTAVVAACVPAPARPAGIQREGRASGRAGVRALLATPALAAVLLVIFAVQAGSMAVQPVLALLVERMSGGAVSVRAGAVFSAAGLASLLGTPAFSGLARRRRAGLLLAVALAGAGATTLLQGLAGSTAQLVLARFGFGLFQSGASVLGNVLVSRAVPADRQGGAFGLASSAWMLGAVAGPVLGGLAAGRLGLRGPFWFAGALLLSLAAWAHARRLGASTPGKDSDRKEAETPGS